MATMHAQANYRIDEPSPRPLIGPYGVPKKRNKNTSAHCVETRTEARSQLRQAVYPTARPRSNLNALSLPIHNARH
nr:hypothetical protein [Pirellula sp.]